ncbi:endocuticle structural glycoprotein SgAbd-2-like [Cimex lectularius]|uniref:CPR type cuticle protein n=1 Tax=Cimex lectularius TaxID=79782 RepID=A0A8I6RS09_CIMLE|nr:endocuticle structural glycoprotein SgAbd-2-like [Cimex lectularius]
MSQSGLGKQTNMNSLLVLFCIVGVAVAQQYQQQYYTPARLVQPVLTANLVQTKAKPVAVLSQNSNFNFDGNFNYDFQSENGISSQVVGSVKPLGPDEQAQVLQGSYSYTAPDGTPVTTNWYADETGFHASGDHLPTPPPVPEAIARSLDFLRSVEASRPQNVQAKY